MKNSGKIQAYFFLIGLGFFAIGLLFYPDVTVMVFDGEFNPFVALGIIFFAIGAIRPFYGLLKKLRIDRQL